MKFDSSEFKDKADLDKILDYPVVKLGQWPTPLEKNIAIENFYIKRDDLSGYGRGGIKTRKLEAMFGYFKFNKISDILMLVPNISNLRADLELYTRTKEKDLGIHLMISNVPKLSEAARQKLFDPVPSYMKLVGSSYVVISTQLIFKYVSLLFSKKKPMFILPSVMHPATVLGTAKGLLELYAQAKAQNMAMPRHIFISACTGGSAAGLVLAAKILKNEGLADIRIHVIKTFEGPLKIWMWLLMKWTKRKFGLKTNVSMKDFEIDEKNAEIPYGSDNPQLEAVCREVKRNFDLNIDPIYGARTWSAMTDFVKNEYQGEGLLYWHCGYTPDWELNKTDSKMNKVSTAL